MEIDIKVRGEMDFGMDKETIYTIMEISTMDHGLMIENKEEEHYRWIREIHTLANGKTVKNMGEVFINSATRTIMKDNLFKE